MRILSAGIILTLLGTHSVGAKREETKDETLSLAPEEERRPHVVHKNQRRKRHTKTRERQESQGKRSSRKTAHLLHTY
jgi:membrane glycosyltransferase